MCYDVNRTLVVAKTGVRSSGRMPRTNAAMLPTFCQKTLIFNVL